MKANLRSNEIRDDKQRYLIVDYLDDKDALLYSREYIVAAGFNLKSEVNSEIAKAAARDAVNSVSLGPIDLTPDVIITPAKTSAELALEAFDSKVAAVRAVLRRAELVKIDSSIEADIQKDPSLGFRI